MERLSESRFDIGMALEAELWLFSFEQVLRALRFVNAVATGTAHSIFSMCGMFEVLMSAGMAGKTALIDLFRSHFVEAANLRNIPATLHMRLTGPMTALAGNALAGMFQSQPGMRVRCTEILHDVLMTGGTGVLPDEFRRADCWLPLGNCGVLLAWACSLHEPRSCEPGQQHQTSHAA